MLELENLFVSGNGDQNSNSGDHRQKQNWSCHTVGYEYFVREYVADMAFYLVRPAR